MSDETTLEEETLTHYLTVVDPMLSDEEIAFNAWMERKLEEPIEAPVDGE